MNTAQRLRPGREARAFPPSKSTKTFTFDPRLLNAGSMGMLIRLGKQVVRRRMRRLEHEAESALLRDDESEYQRIREKIATYSSKYALSSLIYGVAVRSENG